MRHYRVVMAVLAALLLASCGGGDAPTREPPEATPVSPVEPVEPVEPPTQPIVTVTSTPATPTATTTTTPTATPVASATATPPLSPEEQRVADAAIERMADWLGVAANFVALDSIEAVTWTDGCLDVSRPGRFCTLALVPGYRIILRFNDEANYEVRTDRDGRSIVWSPGSVNRGRFEQVTPSGYVRITGEAFSATIEPGVLELRLRPGSAFGVPLDELDEGDLVEVGWAGWPSADVGVLISIDRVAQ